MPAEYSEYKYYKYVKIEQGLYLCLHQNLAILPWLIYLKGKSLRLSPKNLTEAFKSVRRFLGWGKRLTRYGLYFWNANAALKLPLYGHLCLEVHRGYKIFDLHRQTVTKIFKPEVDISTVMMEIERAKTVGFYDFAPRIRRWNLEERWYEEDYVNGKPITAYTNGYPVTSSDSTNFLKTYYQYLAPCIEDLILSQPLKQISVAEYVGRLIDNISKMTYKHELDIDKILYISRFVGSIARRLNSHGNCQVHMVLSHGDFGNNHVIRDNKGVKIIDWEYASHRTILFDLYSCFLEQLFFKRIVPDLIEQINDAISVLEVNLAVKMPAITDGLLAMAEVYRWIFYIEQIYSGMEFFDFSVKAKLKWIDAFNRFEEMQKYNHSHI